MHKPADDLPKRAKAKIERREKKQKPKMRVSGKSVFQLKRIINK
jgi:hypothetical protein